MSTAEQLLEIQPPSPRREFDFLAPERRQKFDLLLHLLANLPRLILLSGPDGIGKTTFLHRLKADALPGWRVCLMDADDRLNLESVQQALAQTLGLQEASEAALTDRLQRMGAANEVVILALDEGGNLLPGVLDAVWRFAAHHKALRVVVAMRPDDLYVKGATDRWAVEEAHVIDIPPLSETQTRSFIRTLWTRLGRPEPDESLVRAVYGLSHGIPARVRQAALERIGGPPMRWHRAMAKPVYAALGIVLSLVIGVTYWQQRQNPGASVEQLPEQARAEPRSQRTLAASPPPAPAESTPQTDPPTAEVSGAQSAGAHAAGSADTGRERQDTKRQTAPAPPPSRAGSVEAAGGGQAGMTSKSQPDAEAASAGADGPEPAPAGVEIRDSRWLLVQDPRHFTWQIAAFDKLEELLAFVREHADLRPLAYYRKRRNGRDWYPLLYGVFPTIGAAREAQAGLPAELGRPWLRRLRSVQKDIRAAESSQP